MENQTSSDQPSLADHTSSELMIDKTISIYLMETCKWGMFLSIVGFVLTGFMVLFGIGFSGIMTAMTELIPNSTPMPFNFGWFGIFYVLMSLIYFFPSLYLFKFSSKTKKGLLYMSQSEMTEAFKNLKSLLKFSGIFTLVFLILYGLIFVAFMVGAGIGAMSM